MQMPQPLILWSSNPVQEHGVSRSVDGGGLTLAVVQVSLASDFVWNLNSREATASFGYDYMLRQCRLRGKIDSDGKVPPPPRPFLSPC